MREVMEQSSDKVLENALANGGESHTYMLKVLIASYRNSLSKCMEAPGYMHIVNETNSYLNLALYGCIYTNIHTDITHILIPLSCISLLHGGNRQ